MTEDCDLGLRLKRYHMNTIILDSTTHEEANPQLKNWLRQRSRWIKGYMQTYLVHMRNPLEEVQKGRLYDLFSFQIVIGIGIGVMFINPLMWMLLGIYISIWPLGDKCLSHVVSRSHSIPECVLPYFRKLLLRLFVPAGMHKTQTVPSLAMDTIYSILLVAHEHCSLLRSF